MEEYEDDELADDSDDEKRLFKAEARAGKKLKQKLVKGKARENFKKPSGWWQRVQPSSSIYNASSNPALAGLGSVQGQVFNNNAAQSLTHSGLSQLGPFSLW